MRKIPNNGNLKMTKVAYPLGLFICLFIYVAYIKWHWASATQAFFSITEVASGVQRGQQVHSLPGMATHSHEVFYGIMFDAGSTGTRVHIFQFTQQPGETPTLTHETFKALKPGLSAYADDVEKAFFTEKSISDSANLGHLLFRMISWTLSTSGIQELLDVAKKDVPFDFWKATPLVLKATAGLRLLPGEKAQKLLQKVKEVFKASPFLVGDDCVSIMNGTDEGVSAWITVNFLTGSLKTSGRSSVGMLDLGGGSTQITFLPRVEDTLQTCPPGYLTSLQMFNQTYKLYSYSYLGLGLMSARLAILGGMEGKPAEDGRELVSPCLSPGFTGEWEHAEITYRISGQKAVNLHELCASRVSEILRNKVHRTEEVKDVDFYAFSYYYDLAANVGLIASGHWWHHCSRDAGTAQMLGLVPQMWRREAASSWETLISQPSMESPDPPLRKVSKNYSVQDSGDPSTRQPLSVHGPHLHQPAAPRVWLPKEQSAEANSENQQC
ncbi:ectonucleoside triphosphate diphosphohydrolase 6 isoform X2 [Suricata suricatta]|uniref:ectonucleoside triphosphate diphosphohydrolase 6 isoform X2 n=1 Tax=Suricata suricatta TaxID=37032 RepID=UPI001155C9E0|nr:ectonucleoside triphosphate diphosphohydrolase 6 isoform X2 [Suricata suricatta]